MRKFNADKIKEQKLRQFRRKYLDAQVYLHLCSECKRHGMMLHMQNCVLCGQDNLFFREGLDLPEKLMTEMMNDIMLL